MTGPAGGAEAHTLRTVEPRTLAGASDRYARTSDRVAQAFVGTAHDAPADGALEATAAAALTPPALAVAAAEHVAAALGRVMWGSKGRVGAFAQQVPCR